MKAATNIDATPAEPVAPNAPPAAAPKPAAPVPALVAYVDNASPLSMFVNSLFGLLVALGIGIAYEALKTVLPWLVSFAVAVAGSGPLLYMWFSLEPGSSSLKTFGLLVLAGVQLAVSTAVLYGVLFLLKLIL